MASTPTDDNAPAYAIATYLCVDRQGRHDLIRYNVTVGAVKLKLQLAFVYDMISQSFVAYTFNPAAGGNKRLVAPLSPTDIELPIAFNAPPARKKPFATVRMLDDFNRWLRANSDIQLVPVAH